VIWAGCVDAGCNWEGLKACEADYTLTWSVEIIHTHIVYIGWAKMAPFLFALTSSNINQFSKFFYCQN